MNKLSNMGGILACVAAMCLGSGCASTMMTRAERMPAPQANKAVVTFVRPSYFGGAIKFGIWDSDRFVGVLTPGSYIQYETDPGEHVFLSRAENWSYVKARLKGGKEYFIVGAVFPGVMKARVALNPSDMRKPEEAKAADDWLARLAPTAPIPDKLDAYVKPRQAQVRRAIAELDQGNARFGVLEAEAGR